MVMSGQGDLRSPPHLDHVDNLEGGRGIADHPSLSEDSETEEAGRHDVGVFLFEDGVTPLSSSSSSEEEKNSSRKNKEHHRRHASDDESDPKFTCDMCVVCCIASVGVLILALLLFLIIVIAPDRKGTRYVLEKKPLKSWLPPATVKGERTEVTLDSFLYAFNTTLAAVTQQHELEWNYFDSGTEEQSGTTKLWSSAKASHSDGEHGKIHITTFLHSLDSLYRFYVYDIEDNDRQYGIFGNVAQNDLEANWLYTGRLEKDIPMAARMAMDRAVAGQDIMYEGNITGKKTEKSSSNSSFLENSLPGDVRLGEYKPPELQDNYVPGIVCPLSSSSRREEVFNPRRDELCGVMRVSSVGSYVLGRGRGYLCRYESGVKFVCATMFWLSGRGYYVRL